MGDSERDVLVLTPPFFVLLGDMVSNLFLNLYCFRAGIWNGDEGKVKIEGIAEDAKR